MCGQCGCGGESEFTLLDPQSGRETAMASKASPRDPHEHVHADGTRHSHAHPLGDHPHGDHSHDHGQHHHHGHDGHQPHRHDHRGERAPTVVVDLDAAILSKNDALAAKNRVWFAGREILALNLVSSPGAGKTTLLERTIGDLRQTLPLFVIEGDQATANDGERIRAAGAPAVQVNTGTGCHLDAEMVARGLMVLKPAVGSVVMIENVGNLVCPALFDLGERAKVVVLSTAEGEDKPLKYPHMFRAAQIMILNKIDLLPHLDYDVARAIANAHAVNPAIKTFLLSARTGEGLAAWYDWLRGEAAAVRDAALV
jgi:hydrogenase nickel incorporation protein HypB